MSGSGLMLGAECSNCGCKPCQACEAECDNTPDSNFQTVYQVNDTDGVLSWSGDAMGPIDGPFTGFEGNGPFSQTITLAEGASIGLPGDRFPCVARFRAWRSIPGGEGSEAVMSSLHISCISGRVNIGPFVLNAGESATFKNAPWSAGETATYYFEAGDPPISLVGGEFDQSNNPPDHWALSAFAECAPAVITVRATIGWTNSLIQHALYGHMMECFDLPAYCQVNCGGAATNEPNELYLTVSNQSDTISGDVPNLEGSYVLDKNFILGGVPLTAFCGYHHLGDTHLSADSARRGTTPETGWLTFFVSFGLPGQGGGRSAIYDFETVVCGGSDSGSVTINILGPAPDYANVGTISFDWELSS